MNRKLFWSLFVVILLFALSPVFSVVIAGTVAGAYDCVLHEGFKNPCIINGTDYGATLYAMGVMGWFMLATLPMGLLAMAVLIGIHVLLNSLRRRKAGRTT